MKPRAHSVAIVVDRLFGERLIELANRLHVWACNSPANHAIAERIWNESKPYSLDWGLTVFNVQDNDDPEQMALSILHDVDLHHGPHSHDPPWSVLEFYGTPPTPAIHMAIQEFGAIALVPFDGGFTASRKP